MQTKPIIAFLGAGNMACSLIAGLIQQGYPANRIWAANPSIGKLHHLQKQYGLYITQDNNVAAKHAEVIVLTVKPSVILTVCQELGSVVQHKKKLIISAAAGITTNTMASAFSEPLAIIRAMPNTPVQVGVGVTGLYANAEVTSHQHDFAESLFRSVGITQWVEHENDLNAITAISGCGPAYFFYIMEGLAQAGEALGLTKEIAHLLTIQTVLGTARLALESADALEALRQRVAPPNGATEAALKVLQEGGLKTLINSAVHAAKQRAELLSNVG